MLKTIQGWWRREEGAQQKPELTLAITRIMVGMMMVDGALDDEERKQICNMLADQFGLSGDESDALIQEASDSTIAFNKVVAQVVDNYNLEERTALLAKLWRVAMADGNISFLEEQYINRISGLIGVPPNALKELKEKEEELFPGLAHSERYSGPNPVK